MAEANGRILRFKRSHLRQHQSAVQPIRVGGAGNSCDPPGWGGRGKRTTFTAGGPATGLDPYLSSFEKHRAESNYKPGTIETFRVLIRRPVSLLKAGGIAPEQLMAELAAQLFAARNAAATERADAPDDRC